MERIVIVVGKSTAKKRQKALPKLRGQLEKWKQ